MEQPIPQNWNTNSFEFEAIIATLQKQASAYERLAYLQYVVTEYAATAAEVNRINGKGGSDTDPEITKRLARVLSRPDDEDSVTNASYHILSYWPNKVLPLLEAHIAVLQIAVAFHPQAQVQYKVTDWEQISDQSFFHYSLVEKECEQISSNKDKIEFLKRIRSWCLRELKHGRLVIVDENDEYILPEENEYVDHGVDFIKNKLDPTIQSLWLTDLRTSGDYEATQFKEYAAPIEWDRNLELLVFLFEELYTEGFLSVAYDDIPPLLSLHFGNRYGRALDREKLRSCMTQAVQKNRDLPEGTLITWGESEPTIVHLIAKLREENFLSYEPKNKYAYVIHYHFDKADGQRYKPEQLQSVKGRGYSRTKKIIAIERVLGALERKHKGSLKAKM